MNKDKLIEVARDAGLSEGLELDHEIVAFANFANAILELAAQECEKQGGPNTPSWFEINEYLDNAAQAIRNLKGTN